MKNEIVKEWFERAKRNFESSKTLYLNDGYPEEIVFLLHQAIEKYLKGYLIFHGWKLKKIHDIYILVCEAVNYDESFKEFLEFGKKLTSFYYEERYPPGPIPEISNEEVREMLEKAERIIELIKENTKL